MSGPQDLYALAAEWLAVCAEAVTATPGGAIPRSYVSPGPPSFDCFPQLTVHPGGPAEADTSPLSPPLAPGQRPSVTGAVHIVNLTATVLRCAPGIDDNGTLPSVAALEASALEIHSDMWAIWNHTRARFRAGTLFSAPAGPGSRELFFDPAFPVQPLGGVGGWQVPIRVSLGGYVG